MSQYYDPHPLSKSKEKVISFEIFDYKISLLTDNGVFSKNRVDEGSLAFLKAIIPLHLGKRILDIGAGYGTIGLTIAYIKTEVSVDLTDVNERALTLCQNNAKNLNVLDRVNIFPSNIYENIQGPYDSIVVNPPIRAGKEVTYAMYEGAKQYLIDGGSLYLVIRKAQGALSAQKFIQSIFGNCTLIDRKKGYYIYQAQKREQK